MIVKKSGNLIPRSGGLVYDKSFMNISHYRVVRKNLCNV